MRQLIGRMWLLVLLGCLIGFNSDKGSMDDKIGEAGQSVSSDRQGGPA
jgi:hypothetical protein